MNIHVNIGSGGSTATNAMLWVCGVDKDYDDWAAFGNPGWDYANILPLIKRTEGNTNSVIVGDGFYHGTEGPLTVSDYSNSDPFISVLSTAFAQIGYPEIPDFNARQKLGVVKLQTTTRDGERVSSYRAFIAPVKTRTNLFIMKNSLVTKVLFDGTVATGVNVKTCNSFCRDIQLYTTKEIILSAGGQGSPQILLHSGIGLSSDLLGAPQIASLPVGYNLQDHLVSAHVIQINPNGESESFYDVVAESEQYFNKRTGPLAEFGITNVNGFINSLNSNAIYPDIQTTQFRVPRNSISLSSVLPTYGFKNEYIAQMLKANQNSEILILFVTLLNPLSTGTIKLASSDPTALPSIDTGYFSNPADIDTMVRAINILNNLISTPAMKSVSASLLKFDIPECDPIPYQSEAYWKCHLKYFTGSLWHPSGTCKMGPISDPSAVVDPTLKVYNVAGLRVADASIMPKIPSGNTQCPTYAIGQKASDLIISDWSHQNF